jgi:hypothetical protein
MNAKAQRYYDGEVFAESPEAGGTRLRTPTE